MLANLMPPPPKVIAPPRPGGRVVVHPKFQSWLAGCELRSANDFLALPGEIVGGHPDRHVARVSLGRGRTGYLKREHLVSLPVRARNAVARFGFVSRSMRELAVLKHLEAAGLPGPQWLAAGRSVDGRAFLLVDEIAGAQPLPAVLAEASEPERDDLLGAVARAVASIHTAGVTTPDLAAKHVLVCNSEGPYLIDWANARVGRPVTMADRAAALAGLAVGLSAEDGLRVVECYADAASVDALALAADVNRRSARRRGRSSVREQRRAGPDIEWVWLDGEAVCVRAEWAGRWPNSFSSLSASERRGVRFLEGNLTPQPPLRSGEGEPENDGLHRFLEPGVRPAFVELLTGKLWRSTGVRLARVAAHLERHGLPVQPVVAFGQRRTGSLGESFVALAGKPADPLWAWLPTATGERRRKVLFDLGAIVRSAHDAACLVAPTAITVTNAAVPGVVLDPRGVEKVKAVPDSAAIRDLRRLLLAVAGTRSDRMRVLSGYVAGGNSSFALRGLAGRLLARRIA